MTRTPPAARRATARVVAAPDDVPHARVLRPRVPATYQAVPGVICYWDGDHLIAHEPVSRRRHAITPLAVGLMHACRTPQSLVDLRRGFPAFSPSSLRRLLAQLTTSGLVVRGPGLSQSAAVRWGAWSPVASFFHFATKDVAWASGEALEALEASIAAKTAAGTPPPPVKPAPARGAVALSRAHSEGEFRSVLLDRRTWRGFAPGPVPLGTLAELLDLTFGIRRWVANEGGERLALKTSPSGGARHPIEAYVVARNIGGLPNGRYHYAPERHALDLLRRGATTRLIETYLGGQWWYRSAAAVVVMAAVLPRVWWRYDTPRAYRSVLLDAGHVCQTFCLVATSLRLAPFCTMALADTRIERDLGLDGITEVVLYAAGVGMRPTGGHVQWPARPRGRTYVSPDGER